MKDYPKWAMLAVNFDDIEFIPYPVVVQPKLNGVRAKWDHEHKLFISRQGKVFPRHVIPHLYSQANLYPKGTSIDGELFTKELSFQQICGALAQNRLTTTRNDSAGLIEFYAFDLIAKWPTEARLTALHELPVVKHVNHTIAHNEIEVNNKLSEAIAAGYEGVMLRLLGAPYINGRTEALIKLKAWQHIDANIIGCVEGKGKLKGSLGAFHVQHGALIFKVGGGNITEEQRQSIWNNKINYMSKPLKIKYREKSMIGVPLQPQIAELPLPPAS